IPGSAADAARLAADLARLLAVMETAGIGFDALARLAPDDHARYFQIPLDFLRIAAAASPAHLAAAGLADSGQRRDRLIRHEAAPLARASPQAPFIAAGSTGSIPATAALLKVIAHLPGGAVVLPGLDQDLDAAGWEAIGDPATSAAASFGHP